MPEKIDIRQYASFCYLDEIRKYYEMHHALYFFKDQHPSYRKLIAVLEKIQQHKKYDAAFDYTSLYTEFQLAAEKVAKHELKHRKSEAALASGEKESQTAFAMDEFFLHIYENDNKINELIYEYLNKAQSPISKNDVERKLAEKTTNPSKFRLSHPDNRLNAFTSMLGIHYHPLANYNIPYVNTQLSDEPRNLRFGAQTQQSNMVNPTFERYLLANARREQKKANKSFHYVYINLLKRPQQYQLTQKDGLFSKHKDKFVRSSEGKRSKALEKLNEEKDLKVAVITLPADNDYLFGGYNITSGKASPHAPSESLEKIFTDLVASIKENKNDFYMSAEVKEMLFGRDFLIEQKLDEIYQGPLGRLFKNVLEDVAKLNIENPHQLKNHVVSPKLRNAILFQFVKSNLTDYILKTIQPSGYNTSCKDAIDRGAIHTLWYQMNLQHQKGNPMTEKEFLTYLDSPAMIVKHRALNHNRNLIWNILDERMRSDPHFNAKHTWANKWLEQNKPDLLRTEQQHRAKPILRANKIGVPLPGLASDGVKLQAVIPPSPKKKSGNGAPSIKAN
jgi:hypothetical protein